MTEQRNWEPIVLGGDVPAPKGAYTPVIRAGDFIHVSGQVPRDPVTGALVGDDVRSQTRQVMSNVAQALAAADATLADIISVTAYLSSADLWTEFNEEYKAIMTPPYPTRTALGADLRGILVEITVVAYKPVRQ
jgi:2-iminobutanoate/2-iminopropanoate deaminase